MEAIKAKCILITMKSIYFHGMLEEAYAQLFKISTMFLSGENERRIRDLELELGAKEDIIGRKQAELSRANQKHYELEQELAFYKIDTKFTSLHKKPDTPSGAVSRQLSMDL